jgi:predicted transcriptional regulator
VKKQKRQNVKFNIQESKRSNTDWWDEISEAEKSSILRGLEDIKAGRVVPHEKVKKLYLKWLTK